MMRYDLTHIQPWIATGSRVLDLGCGDGEFLQQLTSVAHLFVQHQIDRPDYSPGSPKCGIHASRRHPCVSVKLVQTLCGLRCNNRLNMRLRMHIRPQPFARATTNSLLN